jgi:hypothetical protein
MLEDIGNEKTISSPDFPLRASLGTSPTLVEGRREYGHRKEQVH